MYIKGIVLFVSTTLFISCGDNRNGTKNVTSIKVETQEQNSLDSLKQMPIVQSDIQTKTTYNSDSIEQIAEKRLKEFLKVVEGTGGWFNSFVETQYEKGKTVARRGQINNYLWSNKKLVAFHFFTYGGGSNTHYIACVDKNGAVITLEHVLTQSFNQENLFNVERYGEEQIVCTNETLEMNMYNNGILSKENTYVSAIIYGINKDGKLTTTNFE